MRRMMLAVAVILLATSRVGAEDPAEALTRGKLEADQGRHQAAAEAFAAVVKAPQASAEQRWEGLIRLGVARRETGDAKGSVDAFEEAWRTYGKDPDALWFLVQAVGLPLPGRQRWNEISSQVWLEFDRSVPAKPVVHVKWPGVGPGVRSSSGAATISLDFKDGDLQDVFRLFADISGKNIVVNPGVQGRVNTQMKDVPWNEALDAVLSPNGLVALHQGNVVHILRPGDAPAKRQFSGKSIDLEYKHADLVQVLREVAAHGGASVEVADGVAGKVYLRLVGVPWDQAFDLIVSVNGLTWTRTGDVIRVQLRRRPAD